MEQLNQNKDYLQQLERLGITPLDNFLGSRSAATPNDRLNEVKQRALDFRKKMMDQDNVPFFKAEDVITAPYPTKYGYLNAINSLLPVPLIYLGNRVFIMQFETPQGKKTMLFGPVDVVGNAGTPFYSNIIKRMTQSLSDFVRKHILPVNSSVQEVLAKANISPADIDYITYDHMHTQDLRYWLGGDGYDKAFFPNAKLLIMRDEWHITQSPLANQSRWFCVDGTKGIDPEKVILLDSSVMLGKGVALVQTPGHTEGNHSLVIKANDQVYVSSENGISIDNYFPEHSKIPGIRKYVELYQNEVVLNGNTLECSNDQYISMVQEKSMASPDPEHPGYTHIITSSEQYPTWYTWPVRPAFKRDNLEFGRYQAKSDI